MDNLYLDMEKNAKIGGFKSTQRQLVYSVLLVMWLYRSPIEQAK